MHEIQALSLLSTTVHKPRRGRANSSDHAERKAMAAIASHTLHLVLVFVQRQRLGISSTRPLPRETLCVQGASESRADGANG